MRAKTCSMLPSKVQYAPGLGYYHTWGNFQDSDYLIVFDRSLLQKAMFAFMVNAAYIHSIVNDLSISLPHISSIPLPCLPWGKSPEVIHSRVNITAAQKLCLSPSVPPVSPTPRSALVKYSSLSADSSVLLQKQSSYLIIHWFDNQRISSLNERWC